MCDKITETELGASIDDLVDGPDVCPACGSVLRGDHLVDRDRPVDHPSSDNKIRGADSRKIAESILICPKAGGGTLVVKTEDGIESMTSDYRLENGFDE